MAEGAEKKYLSELDFKIDTGLSNLDTLLTKLEEVSKKSEEISKKMTKDMSGKLGGIKIEGTEKMTKAMKTELLRIEKETQKHANKLAEIDAAKNAKIELQNNKLNNKLLAMEKENQNKLAQAIEKGGESRIAEYAKTFIIYQGFNQLKQAAMDTVEAIKDTEYRMMEITRIMNDSTLVVNDYRDALVDLAYEYGRSFDDVSTVTLNFARAGYNAQETLALTEQSLLALNTAELDAQQATDGLISIMAQWGLDMGTTEEKAANLGAIIDKVNKTADNFPISSEGLLEALKRTSQGFNIAGASMDETIAMIVATERASQRGGKIIGTALANMAQQIKTETRINLAESLGIDIFADEAKSQFNSITDIFAQLSEKMVELQEQGKGSSAEMQSLLEVFTVFRRNIGAGLLSEMSGEDSTYLQALETSMNAVGYSAEENSKYMGTMEAATQQLKATVLDLQNTLGDSGGKNLFTAFILGAEGGLNAINALIDTFGLIPVAVGTATLAMAAFNKNLQYNGIKQNIQQLKQLKTVIQSYAVSQKAGDAAAKAFSDTTGKQIPASLTKYVAGLKGAQGSIGGYVTKTIAAKAAQIALNVAVAAGQAALTFGLSLAIEAVVGVISDWIHATENAGKAIGEMNDAINETESSLENHITSFVKLREEYDSNNITLEEKASKEKELIKIQEELTKKYGEQAQGIQLVTGDIEKQIAAIERLAKLDYEQYVRKNRSEIKKLAELNEKTSYGIVKSWNVTTYSNEFFREMKTKIKELGGTAEGALSATQFTGSIPEIIEKYNQLYDYVELYAKEATGKNKEYAYEYLDSISKTLNQLEEKYAESLKEYEEFLNNRLKYDDAYSASYAKILEARANLEKAYREGDSGAIQKAKEDLARVYNDAIEIAKKDELVSGGMTNLLESELKESQKIADNYDIKVKLSLDTDKNGKNLKSEIQETLNKMGDISLEDLKTGFDAGNLTENMKILKEQIESTGYTIDYFIENFENLDFVLGNNSDTVAATKDNITGLKEAITNSLDGLTALENGFVTVYQAMSDFNENGYISASTLQSLVNNDLLQYFDVVNGKLSINEAAMANAATAAKTKAAYDLAAKAAAEIMAVAEGDAATASDGAASSASNLSAKSQALATAMLNVGKDGSTAAVGIKEFWAALKDKTGTDAAGLSEAAKNQINSIVKNFQSSITALNAINITAASYGRVSAKSSGGSSKSSSADDAKKEAEEARKAIIDAFEAMIEERERLEDRWVKNKKSLGLISEKDELYILQKSVERYKTYAAEVNKLTMATEEEKAELRKKYLEEAEDLEVEYFKLLRDLADDQIDALEDKYDEDVDAYEEAIDAKIDKIKEQADAEIEALRAVEDENDRIRQKEEYEARRREIIHGHEGIEYWEQRTGREAQIALAEARKELEELDKDWEETRSQWENEDKIAAIEAERDAQIEAIENERDAYLKSLEEMKNADIAAIDAKYQYELDHYNETGEMILNNATIQAQEMFETYKKNFIDPVGQELTNALASNKKTTTSTSNTITYTIKRGDTLSGIAAKYNTTISKIMALNPYVTNANRIYTGKKLKIPKSHTGSKVLKDGIVELQAGETVLNMKWAKGLDKMLGQFQAQSSNNSTITNNGSTVNVKGDLIKLEAKIDDKSDAAYFSKRIIRELENKFNIKK